MNDDVLKTGEYGDIAPYSDEQVLAALNELAEHPSVYVVSKYLMPREPAGTLKRLIKSIHSIDEFQQVVMKKAVSAILERSSDGLTYDGLENLPSDGRCFLAISNHRDIVMDPAIIQYIMAENGLPFTQICVGDNLLSNPAAAALLRSNRMIKVIRGIPAREMYLSSKLLSSYIRHTVTNRESSVWIAQREGRTKDGHDRTEQGLLKMFDMSGSGSFEDNFRELCIIPFSISYEYEPCDIKKAREVLISKETKYVKKRKEDVHSILTGIRQSKGHIHLHIGEPLSDEEIRKASICDKNDRYQAIRSEVDRKIIGGYKLWKTNYMAYDMLYGVSSHSDHYSEKDMKSFEAYVRRKLRKVEKSLNQDRLREVFLGIYAGPVEESEK